MKRVPYSTRQFTASAFQPGEAGAHNPAAAHFARLASEIGFAIAQAAQYFLRLGFHLCVV